MREINKKNREKFLKTASPKKRTSSSSAQFRKVSCDIGTGKRFKYILKKGSLFLRITVILTLSYVSIYCTVHWEVILWCHFS